MDQVGKGRGDPRASSRRQPRAVGLVHGCPTMLGVVISRRIASICSSMRRLSSGVFMGGMAIGSTSRTIVAMASFSSRPRLMR